MNLGFIGLGNLGKAITGRLDECGHSLTIWNRTPSKAAGMHMNIAGSPSALAETADIVFLCLFDSMSVRSVLHREDGLLKAGVSGKIIIDLTTNHFKDVVEFHTMCSEAGAIYLEAPVLGSVIPASQGALTVLVSGDRDGYEKSRPILENIGNNIFYLEKPGLATRMALVNIMVMGSFMATLAEALAPGEDVGIEKKQVLEILAVGGGNSRVLNAKKNKLLDEDFSTYFSTALIHKNLQYLLDLADEHQKALFTGSLTKNLYAKACEKGLAEKDFSAIYQLFKKG